MLSTTITVNTLADQIDQAGSPTVSLRDAMAQANLDYGDTIVFAPGLASQNAGFGAGVIGLTSVGDGTAGPSALGVSSNVSIVGPSAGPGITIERPATAPGINVPNMRLFYVASTGDLTLDNLTLQGGIALGGNGAGDGGGGAGLGGAVFNQGI